MLKDQWPGSRRQYTGEKLEVTQRAERTLIPENLAFVKIKAQLSSVPTGARIGVFK